MFMKFIPATNNTLYHIKYDNSLIKDNSFDLDG